MSKDGGRKSESELANYRLASGMTKQQEHWHNSVTREKEMCKAINWCETNQKTAGAMILPGKKGLNPFKED